MPFTIRQRAQRRARRRGLCLPSACYLRQRLAGVAPPAQRRTFGPRRRPEARIRIRAGPVTVSTITAGPQLDDSSFRLRAVCAVFAGADARTPACVRAMRRFIAGSARKPVWARWTRP